MIEEARNVVQGCIGENGLWSSDLFGRYSYQNYSRDALLVIMHAILGDPVLNTPANRRVIDRHLLNLARYQEKSTGHIPILFADDVEKFVASKDPNSFMVRSYNAGKAAHPEDEQYGLHFLTPGTTDPDLLFLLFAKEDEAELNLTDAMNRTRARVQSMLVNGRHPGSDHRDNRTSTGLPLGPNPDWPYLDTKPVLSKQCMLVAIYDQDGEADKAKALMDDINTNYWNGTYYDDYPGVNAEVPHPYFDVLGNALACIYGIANQERCDAVFAEAMRNVSQPHGLIPTCDTLLPPINVRGVKSAVEKAINERDHAQIQPFVNGFMMLAMIERGDRSDAVRLFAQWIAHPDALGFYEWYEVGGEGKGRGGMHQGWTAGMFIRVWNALARKPV